MKDTVELRLDLKEHLMYITCQGGHNMSKRMTLQEIASETLTASSVFHALALKPRSRSRIDLRRYKKTVQDLGGTVVDQDYRVLWERLEDSGIGTIEKGANGVYKKFKWKYALSSVGEAGIEGGLPKKQHVRRQLPKMPIQREHLAVIESPKPMVDVETDGKVLRFKIPLEDIHSLVKQLG